MKILHLEDNAVDAELAREAIAEEWPDCQITCVHSRFAYAGELSRSRYDLILSAFAVPSLTGLAALELARERVPGTPFILLSGPIGEDRAIEALCAGADDYVPKDRLQRLNPAIARVLCEEWKRR